jgi:glucose-6-phosphate 1-dehydrogenase
MIIMHTRSIPKATIFVILGGGGDLTWRKLIPAICNLFLDSRMPEHFAVLGMDRDEMNNEAFR